MLNFLQRFFQNKALDEAEVHIGHFLAVAEFNGGIQ